MANLTAITSRAVTITRMPDYQERTFTVSAATSANMFNGCLVHLIVQGTGVGTVTHGSDAGVNTICVGVMVKCSAVAGAAAGDKIVVATGCLVDGLSVEVGTPTAGDIGRPMYLGDDDQEITDWGNVDGARCFCGVLYPNQENTAWDTLYIPGNLLSLPREHGLEVRHLSYELTGVDQTIAATVTGLLEVVSVQATIDEADGANCMMVDTAPGAAGAVTISGYILDDTATPAKTASTSAATIHLTVKGNIRAVLA